MSDEADPQNTPCPVCAHPTAYPPQQPCVRCGAQLHTDVGRDVFVAQLDVHRAQQAYATAMGRLVATSHGPVPASPSTPRRARPPARSQLSAQTLLALAGATLLALAAVVFAAVSWDQLPDLVKVGSLVAVAAAAAAGARRLHRAGLVATGGAVALVSVAATAVVAAVVTRTMQADPPAFASAVRTAVTFGSAAAVAFAGWNGRLAYQHAAAAVATTVASFAVAVAIAVSSGPAWWPFGLLVAAVTIVSVGSLARPARTSLRGFSVPAGVLLAAVGLVAAVQTAVFDGADVAVAAVPALIAAALWARAGLGRAGLFAASSTVVGVAAGVVVTVTPGVTSGAASGGEHALAAAALLAAAGAASVLLLPDRVRLPVLAGLWPAAVGDVLGRTAASGSQSSFDMFGLPVAVTVVATCSAAAVATFVAARDRLLQVAALLLTGAAVAVWVADGDALHAGLAAAAACSAVWVAGQLRPSDVSLRLTRVGLAVMSVLWLAGQPLLATAVAALSSAGLLAAARTDRTASWSAPLVAAAAGWCAVAAVSGQANVYVASSGSEQAGLWAAVAVAAAAVALLRPAGGRLEPALVTMSAAAAVCTSLAAAGTSLAAAASVAAVVTGAYVVVAAVWRHDRAVLAAGVCAAVAGTAATWLALASASVHVPEAYTAVPALLALAVGGWVLRTDADARSATTLGVGLALTVVPTGVQVLADPSDLGRTVALAAVALVAAAGGAQLRLAAPVVAAVVCVGVLAVSQGSVVVGIVPRWVTFAVAGGMMVGVSATFERQRDRVRSAHARLTTMR